MLYIKRKTFFVLALLVFAADQLSKLLIVQHFSPGDTWPLITGIFHFTFVRNFGAAFGILASQRTFFIVISLIVIILIIAGERLISQGFPLSRLGLSLLLGGALGNFWDRLFMGYVIDFVDIRFWPVFNIADAAIVVGVILLFLTFNLVCGDYKKNEAE